MVVPHYVYADSQVLGVLNDFGNPRVNCEAPTTILNNYYLIKRYGINFFSIRLSLREH